MSYCKVGSHCTRTPAARSTASPPHLARSLCNDDAMIIFVYPSPVSQKLGEKLRPTHAGRSFYAPWICTKSERRYVPHPCKYSDGGLLQAVCSLASASVNFVKLAFDLHILISHKFMFPLSLNPLALFRFLQPSFIGILAIAITYLSTRLPLNFRDCGGL